MWNFKAYNDQSAHELSGPSGLWGRLFCEPACPAASSREPRASFCEPRKITPKKSKNGHNALKWYLLHAGSTTRGKFGWNRANDDWSDPWPYQCLFGLFRIPYISEEKYGNDAPVCQNETVSKFWLTEITGPPPEVIPNIQVLRNGPKFQESLHWHN